MASEEPPPILEWTPNVPTAPPITPTVAKPAAYAAFGGLADSLVRTGANVVTGQDTAGSYDTAFWDASGYDKDTVTQALNRIQAAYDSMLASIESDLTILRTQV